MSSSCLFGCTNALLRFASMHRNSQQQHYVLMDLIFPWIRENLCATFWPKSNRRDLVLLQVTWLYMIQTWLCRNLVSLDFSALEFEGMTGFTGHQARSPGLGTTFTILHYQALFCLLVRSGTFWSQWIRLFITIFNCLLKSEWILVKESG